MPLAKSERWTLDHIGNWTDLETATGATAGVYDELEERETNATNEIVSTESDNVARGFEYDDAGNLTAQRIDDLRDAQGAFVAQQRRVFTYDPWDRLVKVALQRRASELESWAHAKTLVAYTYFAGNQRATRTVRASADQDVPSDDDDPPSASEDWPDLRATYVYDQSWQLLEEHVELGFDGSVQGWNWSLPQGSGGTQAFGLAPDDGQLVRVNQYIWDPTMSDELIEFRTGEGEWTDQPSAQAHDIVADGDLAAAWGLTDRNHTLVGLLPLAEPEVTGVDGGGNPVYGPGGVEPVFDATATGLGRLGLQRVRYSSYGVARREVPGDVNADGRLDLLDVVDVGNLVGSAPTDPADDEQRAPYGHSLYRADCDLDADGDVDGDDMLLVSQWYTALGIPGGGSDAGEGKERDHTLWRSMSDCDGATAGSIAELSCASARCIVGFTGAVFDPAVDLWLMRNRWFDPELGVWLSRDPAGYIDGMALYMYVSGNPLVYYDPFGLTKEDGAPADAPKKRPTAIWNQPGLEDLSRDFGDCHDNDGVNPMTKEEQEYYKEKIKQYDEETMKMARAALNAGIFAVGVVTPLDELFIASILVKNGWKFVGGKLVTAAGKAVKGGAKKLKELFAAERGLAEKEIRQLADRPSSLPKGRRGEPLETPPGPPRNPPATIHGREYSGHAVDRMHDRGIPPSAVENTIQHGKAAPGKEPGTMTHYDADNNITVVTNETGRVVTVRDGPPE